MSGGADDDDALQLVERTGAHDPVSTDSAFGDADLLDVTEARDASGTHVEHVENLDAVLAELEAQTLLDSGDLDENDRTLANDSPIDLFAAIPDPEEAPVPQPLLVGPIERRKFQQAPTAFLPAVKVDQVAKKKSAKPKPARPTPVALPVAKPAPPERPKPRRTLPPPIPEPEGVGPPLPAIPSVIYTDEFDEEHTNVFHAARSPRAVDLPRGRLAVVEGEQRGKTWYLNRNRTLIGRGTDNDVVLLDIAVSRSHLVIDRHADGFRVTDQTSGNGTLLNGQRITEAELYDGDRLEVGNLLLEYTTVGAERARASSEPSRVTDPSVALPASPAPDRLRPAAYMAMWLALTFFAVVAGMWVTNVITGSGRGASKPRPAEQALSYVARAQAAMAKGEWELAVHDFQVAEKLSEPPFAHAEAFARARREVGNQQAIGRARARIEEAPLEEVEAILAGVGASSVFSLDKQKLLARARARGLDRQVERAEAALARGRLEVARVLAEAVLRQDAGHARARRVVDAVRDEPGGGGSERAATRPRPDPAGSQRAQRDLEDGARHYGPAQE